MLRAFTHLIIGWFLVALVGGMADVLGPAGQEARISTTVPRSMSDNVKRQGASSSASWPSTESAAVAPLA